MDVRQKADRADAAFEALLDAHWPVDGDHAQPPLGEAATAPGLTRHARSASGSPPSPACGRGNEGEGARGSFDSAQDRPRLDPIGDARFESLLDAFRALNRTDKRERDPE
jgi:hypothetical protein